MGVMRVLLCEQVRADRAVRSSTGRAACSRPHTSAAASAASSVCGLGTYDDFIKEEQADRAAPGPAELRDSWRRNPLRERQDSNFPRVDGPVARQMVKSAQQRAPLPRASVAGNVGSRSELLDYKQQAIKREQEKHLRKQSAIKIQSCFRQWLRTLPPPAAEAPFFDRRSTNPVNEPSCLPAAERTGGDPHKDTLRSPQLSPIARQEFRPHEPFLQWSLHEEPDDAHAAHYSAAHHAGTSGSRSPPVTTLHHGRGHSLDGLDGLTRDGDGQRAGTIRDNRSPPIVTRANQQMHLSSSPPIGGHPMEPSPSNRSHTDSPPIRPMRAEASPPLVDFPYDNPEFQRLKAAIVGHRVRHRMRLHPVKSIVGKIKEAVRLHLEMEHEVRSGPGKARPVEIQILRQLEGTREGAIEELCHALTRLEPPVVSALASGASGSARRPVREKKFLKKGQGRAAVPLDKFNKSHDQGVEEGGDGVGRGGTRQRSRRSTRDRGVMPSTGSAQGQQQGARSPRLSSMQAADAAVEVCAVEGVTTSIAPALKEQCGPDGEGRPAPREGTAKTAHAWQSGAPPSPSPSQPMSVSDTDRMGVREQQRGFSRPVGRDSRHREGMQEAQAGLDHGPLKGALGGASASGEAVGHGTSLGAAVEKAEGEGQRAPKPFLKRKTKSIPVSNGPTTWGHVSSRVDTKFKGIPPVTHVTGVHAAGSQPLSARGAGGSRGRESTEEEGGGARRNRSTSLGRSLGSQALAAKEAQSSSAAGGRSMSVGRARVEAEAAPRTLRKPQGRDSNSTNARGGKQGPAQPGGGKSFPASADTVWLMLTVYEMLPVLSGVPAARPWESASSDSEDGENWEAEWAGQVRRSKYGGEQHVRHGRRFDSSDRRDKMRYIVSADGVESSGQVRRSICACLSLSYVCVLLSVVAMYFCVSATQLTASGFTSG